MVHILGHEVQIILVFFIICHHIVDNAIYLILWYCLGSTTGTSINYGGIARRKYFCIRKSSYYTCSKRSTCEHFWEGTRSYRSKYVQHIWEGTSTLFYFKSALTNYFDVVQEQGGQEVVQEQGEQEVLQVQGEQEVVQLVEQEVVAKENKYKKSISQHKELQAMKNE
jgi:hypothetical protein